MLLFFGSRSVTMTDERGQFNCPQCGCVREYNRKRVRKFGHLYYIPVLPLENLGEFVECRTCLSTYEVSVLNYDPKKMIEDAQAEFEAEFHKAIRGVMILIMLADDKIDQSEMTAIQSTYNQITGVNLSMVDLMAEKDRIENNFTSIDNFLSQIKPHLNDHGKEMVIRAAFFIAAADGVFQEEEKVMIMEIAQSLEISPSHLRGIMSELTSNT